MQIEVWRADFSDGEGFITAWKAPGSKTVNFRMFFYGNPDHWFKQWQTDNWDDVDSMKTRQSVREFLLTNFKIRLPKCISN